MFLSVYEIITDNRTYFYDWNTTISDGFAIYTPVFVVWLNVWVINAVYLIDRLMRDAIRFEKSTAQFRQVFFTYSKRKNSRNRS